MVQKRFQADSENSSQVTHTILKERLCPGSFNIMASSIGGITSIRQPFLVVKVLNIHVHRKGCGDHYLNNCFSLIDVWNLHYYSLLLCGLFYEAICCMSFHVSFCSWVFQSF